MAALDCVIVGSNEVDVHARASKLLKMREVSGAYFPLITSLANHRGRWMGGMELLNVVLKEATGRDFDFHILDLPNLAVCHLASYLLRRDFRIAAVNFFNKERERLAALLRQGPRAVAISTSLYGEEEPIREVVEFVRKHNDETTIIVGGPFLCTLCSIWDPTTQDHLLSKMGADVYIHEAHGVQTLSAVLRELAKGTEASLRSIPNLILPAAPARPEGSSATAPTMASFDRTPRKVEDVDLDDDTVDWSYFPKSLYSPMALIRTSCGCPYSCSFCTYPTLGGAFRSVSLEVLERELRQLAAAGVRNLLFVDDTFNASPVRFKEILEMMLRNRFDFSWYSMLRVASADDEAFDLMQASGCVQLQLGIESGSQAILDAMGKQATVEQYKAGIRRAQRRGIRTITSCIVGHPGETQATVHASRDFIQELQPTYYFANLYFHSSNAPIARRAKEFGLKGSGYSWRHDTMAWQEACGLIDEMYRTVEGPLLPPHYMFYSSFAPPYLESRGIARAHVDQFIRLWQPLVRSNLAGTEHDFSGFFRLGAEIARTLGGQGT